MIWEEKWLMIFELILGSDYYIKWIVNILKKISHFEKWEIL